MNTNEYTTLKEQYYNILNKLNRAMLKEDSDKIIKFRIELNNVVSKMLAELGKKEWA